MNQLSEEQRELVSQIRERHLRVDCYKSQMRADINFLLSLNEQLLAEHERLNAIVSAYENEDEEALAEAYKL